MYISLKIHWALTALLQLRTSCLTAGHLDPIRAATIPVETIEAPLLPQAQQDGVCTIITVKGLGFLDGDYSMLENLLNGEKPSWIGTSPDTQDLLLSWNPLAQLWTIGNRGTGLYHAYVPAEEGNIPPGSSSQWQMFDSGLSDFREIPEIVTVYCPGERASNTLARVFAELQYVLFSYLRLQEPPCPVYPLNAIYPLPHFGRFSPKKHTRKLNASPT